MVAVEAGFEFRTIGDGDIGSITCSTGVTGPRFGLVTQPERTGGRQRVLNIDAAPDGKSSFSFSEIAASEKIIVFSNAKLILDYESLKLGELRLALGGIMFNQVGKLLLVFAARGRVYAIDIATGASEDPPSGGAYFSNWDVGVVDFKGDWVRLFRVSAD